MNTDHNKDDQGNAGAGSSTGSAGRPILLRDNRIDSRDLFAGAREVAITHGDETYRLRLTAQNKLILTK